MEDERFFSLSRPSAQDFRASISWVAFSRTVFAVESALPTLTAYLNLLADSQWTEQKGFTIFKHSKNSVKRF